MPATIESLPVELVVHVANYLDFQPACSLRLASRTLADKLSPACLPQFFVYKNVKLDYESLNEFAYMTYPGRAGCVLQHCTITGVAGDEPGEPALTTRRLNDAFAALKRNSPRAGLVSLRVNAESPTLEDLVNEDAQSLQDDDDAFKLNTHRALRILWRTAQEAFETTMAALRESHLPVSEHVELRGVVHGCNLSYRETLLRITQLASATTVFSSLKKLTMSLSSMHMSLVQIPNSYDRTLYGKTLVRQSMHGSSLLQRLLAMLVFMPHLEELDIYWYNVGSSDSSSLEEDDTMNLDVTPPFEPPHLHLKACSLRGLYVAGEDLLRYLKAVRPTKLTLTDIRLIPGTWTPIFECLSSSSLPITSYHLDDLREGRYGFLVHFDDVPGQAKFPYRGVQMGPSTLTRRMSEIGTAIRYQCTTRRPLGSGARTRWLEGKTLEFGPPHPQWF
ncbi:hypothetical protein F5Y07DRAFT_403100 [Xylaria sp. FL0933]|nr:hypothetical protein F5Y07DRAFT_403100 [Xylaria sp. FL0933]